MVDSVTVLETSRNASSVETTLQSWIDEGNHTDIGSVSIERRGQNRLLIIVPYTADTA